MIHCGPFVKWDIFAADIANTPGLSDNLSFERLNHLAGDSNLDRLLRIVQKISPSTGD